jgi:hypothetical protein
MLEGCAFCILIERRNSVGASLSAFCILGDGDKSACALLLAFFILVERRNSVGVPLFCLRFGIERMNVNVNVN